MLPGSMPLVLASRRPLRSSALRLIRRPLVDRGAADLTLSPGANARVLRDEHGLEDAEVAEQVHDLTVGWPALVHLAGDALGRQGVDPSGLLAALSDPGSAAAAWVRDHVLADLSRPAAQLLDLTLDLGPVTAALVRTLPLSPGWAGRPGRPGPGRRSAGLPAPACSCPTRGLVGRSSRGVRPRATGGGDRPGCTADEAGRRAVTGGSPLRPGTRRTTTRSRLPRCGSGRATPLVRSPWWSPGPRRCWRAGSHRAGPPARHRVAG